MAALLCAQCNAPLSMEAAQGRAPCGYCNVVNAPPGNPYGTQAFARAVGARAPQTVGDAWICGECRKENQAHYRFCLGCGAATRGEVNLGAAAIPQRRSSAGLIILVAVALVVMLGGLAVVGALVMSR